MLNCMATYRGTDKKPCDNNLNIEPAGKVIDNINFGGDAMTKLFANNSSLARSFEAAVDVSKSLDVSKFTKALGSTLPLCRVTDTDHRVNSAEVPRGSR